MRRALAVLLLLLAGAAPARAAELAVTGGHDAGEGSLRAALEAANATPEADVIGFTGPHVVAAGPDPLPALAGRVALDGAGGRVSGSDLVIAGPAVTISRLGVAAPHRLQSAVEAPGALALRRGSDGVVRVLGSAPAPGVLELFGADGGEFRARFAEGAGAGPFAVPLESEPAAGERFTMTLTTSEGTSGFAPAALAGDLTSPQVTGAQTVDPDRDGRADAVRLAISERVLDGWGFGGLVVEGGPFAAVRSGSAPDDAELELPFAVPQRGDVRPAVRVAGNGTLADAAGNQVLVMQYALPAADAVAPGIASALALNERTLRVRFTEAVVASTVTAGLFELTMGAEPRAVRSLRLSAARDAVDLRADKPWPPGTAGTVRLRGGLEDLAGNVLQGTGPEVRVFAAPGDTRAPVLSRVRLAHRTICAPGVSRSCTRAGGTVGYTVDEDVTIVLDLRRAGSRATNQLGVARRAGAGTVRFGARIEGHRLRPGSYFLTVTAVDAAGNESRAFPLRLTVRR